MEDLEPVLWDAVELWLAILGIWLEETDTEWPLVMDIDGECEGLPDGETLVVCTREELLGDELECMPLD